jgi:hypothetical protein
MVRGPRPDDTSVQGDFTDIPGDAPSIFLANQQAREQHTIDEWTSMSATQRDAAVQRWRYGLPANIQQLGYLSERTARAWDERGDGPDWGNLSWQDRGELMRRMSSGRDLVDSESSVDSATRAVMDVVYPARLNDPPNVSGFPGNNANMNQLADAAILRLSNQRPGSGMLTDRAVALSRASPEWDDLTNIERRAEARRIRRQLAIAQQDNNPAEAEERFVRSEARRAHGADHWEQMFEPGRASSVERARLGLPYKWEDFMPMWGEARRSDPSLDPTEFDDLPMAEQNRRVARFFARRRQDEPQ